MKNLLNKKELLLLSQLNENAVPWNKSALGILSNAALRPFSWLSGNIKKGLKKQQINNLIQQYGLEIVNAIYKIDTNDNDIENSVDTDVSTESTDNGDEIIDDKIINNAESYLHKFKDQLNIIQKIKPVLHSFISLDHLDTKNNDFLKLKKIIKDVTDIVDVTGIYMFLRKFETPGTDNYEQIIKTYKKYTNEILEKDSVQNYINIYQSAAITIKNLKIFENTLSNLEDLYDLAIIELEEQLKINVNESNGYKLPKNVTSLFSNNTLKKIEQIPNIKEKMEEVINKVRLNTIAYEANYIIETSDKDKTQLQHRWQVGIQNIRDYFQNVIDPNLLPLTPSGNIDTNIKSQIQKDQKQLSELQKLDITDTLPVGSDLESNALYAFDCIIGGQNGKNLRTILLLSPVENFKESITDNKYMYFKVFGGYKYDKTVERINIFKYLTNNQKMINDLNKDSSYFYIATKDIKPSNKFTFMFIYSGDGKVYFNNETDDINNILSTLQKYKDKNLNNSIKNIEKIGNIMKLTINQRFIIDSKNIQDNKYPGITLNAVKARSDIKRTINNHKKLIDVLS